MLEVALKPRTGEEREILAMNETLRGEFELKPETDLALRFNIPTRHLAAIRAVIPQMQTQEAGYIQERAWKWFLRDELSKPYRVKA